MTNNKDRYVVLINPSGLSIIPFGLYFLSSYVRKQGYKVKIIDNGTGNVYKQLIKIKDQILICGITACTDTIFDAYQILKFIKEKIDKNIICVIGGPHASSLPYITLQESQFDILVIREGEITFYEIIKKIENNQFPTNVIGCYEKDRSGKITFNGIRSYIQDLDSLPPPAFDLISLKKQFHFLRLTKESYKRIFLYMCSRGCPFDCPFCSSKIIWNRRLRLNSVDYTIKEIHNLIEKYNIKGLSFLDDDFLIHKKWISEFCNKFILNGLSKKLVWSCQARSQSLNPDILKLIKKAGCILIRIGIESGSDNSLNFLKDGTTKVEDNYKAVRLCNQEKMLVTGTMIIGSPDETLNDIIDTIKFMKTAGLDNVDIFVATPYPGTRLYEICKKRNYLKKDLNWKDFVTYKSSEVTKFPIARNKNFTVVQLHQIKIYIDKYVVSFIKKGSIVPEREFEKELQNIINGDNSLIKISLFQKIKSIFSLFKLRYFYRAIHNPKKALQTILYYLGISEKH